MQADFDIGETTSRIRVNMARILLCKQIVCQVPREAMAPQILDRTNSVSQAENTLVSLKMLGKTNILSQKKGICVSR